jgi:hypothetical protein
MINKIDYATLARVESGIFFIRGEFVLSETQEIFFINPRVDGDSVSDYLVSGKVAFQVEEGVVTSGDDITLLDNANGEPNYAAPGADRYFINLNLVFISDYDGDENGQDYDFIDRNETVISVDDADADLTKEYTPLLTIVNNEVQETTSDLLSDNLTNILAKRTSEESGDYAIDPFVIDIRDFYNDTSDSENRGLYTEEQIRTLGITVGEDDISGLNEGFEINTSASSEQVEAYGKSRFVIGVEPSIAYVDGYRIESESRIDIPVEKARTEEINEDIFTTARLGNYILGSSITGLPIFGNTVAFTNGTTAKIRNLEFINNQYRLYLYDISGSIESAVETLTSTGFTFTRIESGLLDTEFTRSLYELPYENISKVDENGVEFVARISDSGSVQDSKVSLSLSGSNERFFDENENSYIVTDESGTIVNVVNVLIEGTNNNSVTLTLAPTSASNVNVLFSYKSRLELSNKSSIPKTEIITNLNDQFQELEKIDVYSIDEVKYFDGSGDEVKVSLDEIVLDDGQREGVYKKSRVRYIGETNIPTDTQVTIKYKYFTHGDGDYYSRDSYGVNYEDIPSYRGVRLSDVLDFRPDDGASYNTATLDPNSVIEARVNYYLNRVDKVVVNSLGEFKVINGIPALDPDEPETPDNAMHLYSIDVPAYTFDVKDVQARYVDNRRYTMRDIGELEDRIKNLEYFTSLSMLEKEASTKQIFDTDVSPFERFKNGILVDNFVNHSVGDVNDPGYLCSIDGEDGLLRPSFDQESIRLKLDDNETTYGDFASLEYDLEEVTFIDQPSASVNMSVNPYAVAAWWGEIKLSPSSDEWKETKQRPDVVVNRENDSDVLRRIANAERAQGTIWRSWSTNWTGRSRRRWTRRGRGGRDRRGNRTVITTRRTGVQTREGIRSSMSVEKIRNVVNEKVVDTSFVPFIRSRRIYFKGKMFRPDTRLYLYFDNENISDYATKTTFVDYKNSTDTSSFKDQLPSNIFENETRNELITDENGNIEGYFVIPNNAALKFRTGEREVVFTDSPENDPTESTTSATVEYSARGVIQHKQRTVVSTRRVRITRERVTQSRNIVRETRRTVRRNRSRSRRRWRDPLAQSFMIGEIESGLYTTSLDLYFQQKSKNVPVQMYLVTMDNGYPTQEVIPGSEVTKLPSEVNVSSDASIATNFKFDSPVYLEPGIEYAIVVLSNDDAYRMWLSEIGKNDVNTGKTIVKNPYTGVMFKSQNASTWTADQNKDFKFTFYRAKYEENAPRELIFNALGVDSENPIKFSQLNVISEFINLPQTSINYQISIDGGTSYYDIVPSEDVYLNTGSTDIDDGGEILVKATLSTESEYVTPVIDLDRTSLVTITNYVNGVDDVVDEDASPINDTETNATHGEAYARYITGEVELNNPADQLNVYLNINRPTDDANVKVYARFKTGEESLENISFVEVPAETVIPISSTALDFDEVPFKLNRDGEYFTGFQIKIVMLSPEHQNVPSIKDLRAIAST